MAFVRVSRDKRGYEHIYLIDATARRGKASRPRVLYWFRTPPGVMVGREPFDESVRRTLEAQYPDVTFDWEKLRKTAIPAPDVEPWRERRRVERAAKQARQAGERDETEAPPHAMPQEQPSLDADSMRGPGWSVEEPEGDALPAPAESDRPGSGPSEGTVLGSLEPFEPVEPLEPLLVETDAATADFVEVQVESVTIQAAPFGTTPPQTEQRRRRRRRGGRRRRQPSGPEGNPSSPSSSLPKEDEPTG